MQEKIENIRILLSEIESRIRLNAATETVRVFSGSEFPDVTCDIVDLLMPNLSPYEAAFYWYIFRHSVVETGTQLIRISTRSMQKGVTSSAYTYGESGGKEAGSAKVSESKVRGTLAGLEKLGAIRKEGEPNRDGTLYRLFLPEEIPVCQKVRAERNKTDIPRTAAENEADYYNIRENRLKVYERDAFKCQHCGKQLTRFTATLDHVHAVAKGGNNSLGNLVTACRECNSKKNSRLLGDFLADENPT